MSFSGPVASKPSQLIWTWCLWRTSHMIHGGALVWFCLWFHSITKVPVLVQVLPITDPWSGQFSRSHVVVWFLVLCLWVCSVPSLFVPNLIPCTFKLCVLLCHVFFFSTHFLFGTIFTCPPVNFVFVLLWHFFYSSFDFVLCLVFVSFVLPSLR